MSTMRLDLADSWVCACIYETRSRYYTRYDSNYNMLHITSMHTSFLRIVN